MEIINFHTIYILTDSTICIVLFFLLRARIDRLRLKRIRSLKKKNINSVVETETPLENPEKVQRKIGQESIETRFNFLKKFLPVVIAFLWFMIVITPYLQRVPAIYVSIIIGSISVLLGMAARPFVENLVSGLVISFAQPIRIGDAILLDEKYGLVEDIKLTHSIINMWDWRRLVIPNSQMLNKEVVNYSLNDHHIWAWVEFHVSSDADIELVENIGIKVAKGNEHFLPVEDPSFWVMRVGRDSIRCWLAAWVDNPTAAWEIRDQMRKGLVKEFRKHGISLNRFNYAKVPDGMMAPKEAS